MSTEQQSETQPVKQAIEIAIRLGLVILLLVFCLNILSPFISLVLWASVIAVAMSKPSAALQAKLGGSKIYSGFGMHAKGGMWMCAFLTIIVMLAPAVMDSQGGSSAGAAFYSRLFLIAIVAVYGTIAVAVFDAFWKSKNPNPDTDYVEDFTPI